MGKELNAEEFYRRRDDRTNRLTSNRDYHNLHVRLIADESIVRSYVGQVQLLTATNMLARWCRWIELGFPNAPLVEELRMNGWGTLHERVFAEVSQADPFGRFTFNQIRSPEVEYTLQIGKADRSEPVNFTIDSDGWTAYAGTAYESPGVASAQKNPVGAAFAACLGVADAFKVATEQPIETRVTHFALSLFDFCLNGDFSQTPDVSGTISLGNVQLVGVGSVGSAIAYLLRMLPLEGQLTTIDHDPVEIENLNRSPLFGIKDDHQPKALIVAQYLEGHIPVEPFVGRYDEFIQSHGRGPGKLDLIIPVANEHNVRADIENNYPPIQTYATTTSSWGINYHRHYPLSYDDCSVCRFPPPETQPNFSCSVTQVETPNEKPIDAALPFLSMSAAVLTVADLIKLQLPGYPFTPNFAFIDFLGKMETILTYSRQKKADCICANRSHAIHSEYISSTRYFTVQNSGVQKI